ncbi:MarR family transcriptional regulator [Candidatus Woesearchaeota archaeon]|nr:MarR family transcriptional regulator [Candidatus Woesearchaeota archaeon]
MAKDEFDEIDKKELIKFIKDENLKLTYKPITAHDLLTKSEEEIKEKAEQQKQSMDTRERHKLMKNMKILAAIMLGKKSNKELAKVLDTDKSYASKQIKKLQKEGLVHKKGEGRKTEYEVNEFNFINFLTSKVKLRWGGKKKSKKRGDENK